MILLSPYVQSVFIVEGIILLLFSIGLYWAIKISLEFDARKSTSYQYSLNKKSYLVATIIKFALLIKLPLFLFFIWTMDALSNIVSGAMCAAGIVSATKWGTTMLMLKIIVLFGLCGWLLLHVKDMAETSYPFTKLKFILFQPLFILIALEFTLEIAHFTQISTDIPVQCCSVLFTQDINPQTRFFQKETVILSSFYGLFICTCSIGFLKRPILFGLSSLAFMFSSIHALIRFFSSYVYELPTHKCPFCLLQSDYYYVGYLIYILLFLGTSSALGALLLHLIKRPVSNKWYRISMGINTLLVLLLSAYPLAYFLKNGVWL